ncbi:hypothetical protein [Bacteroides sp. 41_26]|jgi:hypothetical protein|uniref:hypothetical protein n=1 Tax=Bacteroides TaxID=816 RepID=UPI000964B827|nr:MULTISPECIES: hypothetical protein [Bacteroides]OKZ04949.1 MAG: hypothetical protein BHV71_09315 [Bacteroides sp. 41_26]DAX77431.1 MAG TPA: hypothetical protein [Caudoviricetes sp.]
MNNTLFVVAIELRQNAKKEDVESLLGELGEWIVLLPNVYAIKLFQNTEVSLLRDSIYERIENDLRVYVGEMTAAAWRISLESSEWLKKNIGTDEQE